MSKMYTPRKPENRIPRCKVCIKKCFCIAYNISYDKYLTLFIYFLHVKHINIIDNNTIYRKRVSH